MLLIFEDFMNSLPLDNVETEILLPPKYIFSGYQTQLNFYSEFKNVPQS